jgi:hypothetical protein
MDFNQMEHLVKLDKQKKKSLIKMVVEGRNLPKQVIEFYFLLKLLTKIHS